MTFYCRSFQSAPKWSAVKNIIDNFRRVFWLFFVVVGRAPVENGNIVATMKSKPQPHTREAFTLMTTSITHPPPQNRRWQIKNRIERDANLMFFIPKNRFTTRRLLFLKLLFLCIFRLFFSFVQTTRELFFIFHPPLSVISHLAVYIVQSHNCAISARVTLCAFWSHKWLSSLSVYLPRFALCACCRCAGGDRVAVIMVWAERAFGVNPQLDFLSLWIYDIEFDVRGVAAGSARVSERELVQHESVCVWLG